MQDIDDYCARVVREGDKERFLATLFAPASFRPTLFALYAFESEVARVAERVTQPLAGEVRLQWWYDIVAGKEQEQPSGNPVAVALTEKIRSFGLPQRRLLDLIEARRFDLYQESMATLTDFEIYAERSAGAVFDLAAHILNDGDDPGQADLMRHAGIAFAGTRLLSGFFFHATHGRLYVPAEVFQRHDAAPQDALAGQVTPQWRGALAEMRIHALGHLAKARDLLTQAPGAIVPAFLQLALVRPCLARMERADYHPRREPALPQWRTQWRLWRAAKNLPAAL